MATIKNYTDISQSKKLAEILPLESADTIWDLTNPDLPTIRAIPYEDSDYNNKYLNIIPCWSLAALLGVLPYPSLHKTFAGWRCDSYDKEGKTCKLGENTDNPVDACYEMIVKLHELKML